MKESEPMYLHYFTQNKNFPFYIQDGHHHQKHKWHHHADFTELVIVLDGTAMQQVNEKFYYIKRGDVFVLADGVSHIFTEPHDLHICNIMFQPEQLTDRNYDLRKLPGFHALFVIEPYLAQNSTFKSHLKLEFQEFDDVQKIIHCMFQEYQGEKPGYQEAVMSYFRLLVTQLSRYYEPPAEGQKLSGSLGIATSISYMEENFRKDCTVEELAQLSHMSSRHFTRLFSATYHTTPKNYMLQLRLQYACKLLEQPSGSLSITQIAYDSGFNNSNYFTRLFHKVFHMTPGEYRRQISEQQLLIKTSS